MPAAPHQTFDKLMPYTVTVKAKTSTNTYGEPVYSAVVQGPWKALIIDQINTSRDSDGIEFATTTTAYINTDGNRIGSDDQITMPSQFGGADRKIGQVIHWPAGSDGAVHSVEVNFL